MSKKKSNVNKALNYIKNDGCNRNLNVVTSHCLLLYMCHTVVDFEGYGVVQWTSEYIPLGTCFTGGNIEQESCCHGRNVFVWAACMQGINWIDLLTLGLTEAVCVYLVSLCLSTCMREWFEHERAGSMFTQAFLTPRFNLWYHYSHCEKEQEERAQCSLLNFVS